MMPAPFDYQRPDSVAEALSWLARYGAHARVLAGGQSLLPLLKTRAVTPAIVVDIGGLAQLRGISRQADAFRIGALVTQAELTGSEALRRAFPLLAGDVMLGDPIVCKRGTFAGALAFADPASDWPAIALVLDAQLHVSGVDGQRTLPIREFFRDSFATALAPTDLLLHVTLPDPPGRSAMMYRSLRHPASGYALVGVAALVQRDANGMCTDCRVAVTGAGRTPVRARAVELALKGQRLTGDTIGQAAARALEGVELVGDAHAGVAYRGALVSTFVQRALGDALAACP